MIRTLGTLPTATINEQRHLTILDPSGAPVICGKVIASVGIGTRVQVTLNLMLAGGDRWPVVLGPLDGDTACEVGNE